MSRFVVGFAVCMVLGGAAVAESTAAPNLSKSAYIARGDAICRAAGVQLRKLPPTTTMASVAAKGPRWLTISRRALKAMRALTPPVADRARVRGLLTLADRSINRGIAGFVAAARRRDSAAYAAAGRRAQAMIKAARRSARAYGFSICSRL